MSDGSIIIDTILDTKEFKSQMGKLKGITNSGMKPALVSIGAITAAITGVSASAVKFGTDYQKACNQLQASTNVFEGELDGLNNVMKKVYANNFGEDMNDVANAVSTVRKELGALDETTLQNVTEYAFTLRDTFGYDINESVRSAKALMDNFGISGEEAFNLITQGAQNGLDYSGELLDTISEYSVQFSKLGFSAEDMFNVLQTGAENGAFNLDKVGDAVKEFSIRAIDGSNTTIDGFTRLGLNADEMAKKFASGGDTAREAFEEVVTKIGEMDNQVDQSIVGVDLFGTMWEDLGPEVVTQLSNLTDEYNQATNSAEKLSQVKYNDIGSAIQGIGRQIQTNLLLPIGEKLLPIFNDLANKLNEAFSSGKLQSSIDKIAGAIGSLVEGVAGFVEKWLPSIIDLVSWIIANAPTIISLLAGITAGMKVFQVGKSITNFISGFKSATTAVQGVSGAFKVFNSVLNANPILMVVSVIATLVTALITLWNTNEDFRNAVINAWNTIKETIGNVVNGIISFFTQTIPNAFNSFIAGLQGLGQTIWDTLVNAWNSIVSFFTEGIPSFINSIIQWIQNLPYQIGYFIGQILGHIIQFGIDAWNWVTTELPNIINNIVNWFSQLPGRIADWLKQAVQNIINWGAETWQKANQAMSNFFNGVVNWFKQLPGNIWNWLMQTINNIAQWGSEIKQRASQAVSELVDNIINTIKALPGKMLQWGKDMIQGLINGIKSMLGGVGKAISGIANGIKSVIHFSRPDKGPLRDYETYMPDMINGLVKTLRNSAPKLYKESEILANKLSNNLDLTKAYERMRSAVDFETQKLSANLSTTATSNKVLTANITMQPSDVYLNDKKVGRLMTPSVSKTLRGAGAH